jgi:alpha-N-arabinofuranosidase
MRDAMVAAFSLNTFHQYTERVKMTNIAQVANVLQSMVLTKGDKMVLTPTYHVFRMYTPNMEAINIPVSVTCETFEAENEQNRNSNRVAPYISVSASKSQDGTINVNIANADLDNSNKLAIDLGGIKGEIVNAEILTSKDMKDHNTFEVPNKVVPTAFKGAKLSKKGELTVEMPKMSIVTFQIKTAK